MNRGEQIVREIIGMDKKHTWKYLSLVAASPQAPSKKRISSENLYFRKTLPPVVFCPSKGIPLKKKKTLSLWFSQPALAFSCSLFISSSRFPLFQPSTHFYPQPPPWQGGGIYGHTFQHARLLQEPALTLIKMLPTLPGL